MHNFSAATNTERRDERSAKLRRLQFQKRKADEQMLDRIALILTIIGALNWGSIGIFRFDIVAWICGGQGAVLSRIIYTVVALAGLWCISLLFRERREIAEAEQ